jgi:hypothetical protein
MPVMMRMMGLDGQVGQVYYMCRVCIYIKDAVSKQDIITEKMWMRQDLDAEFNADKQVMWIICTTLSAGQGFEQPV